MVADFGLAEKIPDIRWVTLMGAGVTEGTEAKGKTPVSSSEARTWSQPNLSSLNSVNFGVPILGGGEIPNGQTSHCTHQWQAHFPYNLTPQHRR